MFTGIVETTGIITKATQEHGYTSVTIQPDIVLADIKVGDSVSVNGVCLTITNVKTGNFCVDIVPETQRLTNLSAVAPGCMVNLERSLTPSTRMGGHFVQGHVDNCATISNIVADQGEAKIITFHHPADLGKFITKKGYICIDGMSLTVVDTWEGHFTITLIPHTQQNTIARHYMVGQAVNLEVDMMAKQVEKILGAYKHAS